MSLLWLSTNSGRRRIELCVIGDESYTKTELLKILNTSAVPAKRADASMVLAYQLIAAKLNVANGSEAAPISGAINAADALLAAYVGKLPYAFDSSSAAGQRMVKVASELESYNRGWLTRSCGSNNPRPNT